LRRCNPIFSPFQNRLTNTDYTVDERKPTFVPALVVGVLFARQCLVANKTLLFPGCPSLRPLLATKLALSSNGEVLILFVAGGEETKWQTATVWGNPGFMKRQEDLKIHVSL